MRITPYNPLYPYIRECVRCNGKFTLPNHPMAHASSICPDCRKIKEESILDQTLHNMKLYL